MEQQEKNLIVSFALSGELYFRYNSSIYKIQTPSASDNSLADFLALELVHDKKFGSLLSTKEAEEHLDRLGMWTKDDESRYKESEKHLEQLKIALYDSLHKLRQQKSLRSQIKGVKKAMKKAYAKKNYFFDKTKKYYQHEYKLRILLSLNIYDYYNKPLTTRDKLETFSSGVLDEAMNQWALMMNHSHEDLRDIVRTSPWSNKFGVLEEKVLTDFCRLNDIQLALLMYSKMYDNARQSMDCPPEDVFKDDDMFDGWMAKQRQEAEETRNKRRADKKLEKNGKSSNAGEMYLLAEDPQEANEVSRLNSFADKMRLRDRMREVKNRGEVEELNLTDTQMKLRRQMMEQQKR